jgi:aryl-alcohol dehydrogenase-like predicted oxidoreductase
MSFSLVDTQNRVLKGAFAPQRITGKDRYPFSIAGFGTAQYDDRVLTHGREALRAAWDTGINWIDLAPDFGRGRATESVASALSQIPSSEGLAIVWKTPPRHSLQPEELAQDLALAQRALGAHRPWFVVLRDPEFITQDPNYLSDALDWLAHLKVQKKIFGFGVGSQGFALDSGEPGFYSLPALWETAQSVLGERPQDSGFHLVQAPFNLLEPGIIAASSSQGSTPAEFALKHGLQLLTYRPLHAWEGRRFVRCADFPDRSHDENLHERFKQSIEKVTALEQSHSELAHGGIGYRIRRSSGNGPSPLGWSNFLRWDFQEAWNRLPQSLPKGYREAVQDLLRDYTAWVEDESSQLAAQIKSVLWRAAPEFGPTERLSSMSQRLLWSLPAVSGVACGLTHPVHVESTVQAARAPRLRAAQAVHCFQQIDEWKTQTLGRS